MGARGAEFDSPCPDMTDNLGTRSQTIAIEQPLTLEKLRWLVNQCTGMLGSSIVDVKEYKEHSQIEWDKAKISVTGELE